MAVARESLSPLIRNARARRFSLELCQKIGNHLLSPSGSGLSPSPSPNPNSSLSPNKNQSPGNNASMNWSSSSKSLFSSNLSTSSVINNNSNSLSTSTSAASFSTINVNNSTNSPYRRGSADHDVFKSLSPMLLCGGNRRRSSLTPLLTTYSVHNGNGIDIDETECNHQSNLPGSPHTLLQHQHQLPYQIPSINIQDSPNYRYAKEANTRDIRYSIPRRGSSSYADSSGLFCTNCPFSGEQHASRIISQNPAGNLISSPNDVIVGKRRKSSSSRYDFDEEFMQFVTTKCNLQLFPEIELGRGSFGTVILGKYYGGNVAVKAIQTKYVSHFETMKGEQNALGLQHPHIALVIDIFQMGPERALVVMELLKKGNLLQVLNDTKIVLASSAKVRISGQIASALQFCHQHGILHLDVKPQNILVDQNDNCKLADFGTSKKISDFTFISTFNKLDGTVIYKAPELFRGNIPTEKCDVYSFGICMWQILHREEPYRGLEEHSVIYQVVAHGLRPTSTNYDSSNNFGNSYHSLSNYIRTYENCWHAEPDLRPDMKTVMNNLLLLLYKV